MTLDVAQLKARAILAEDLGYDAFVIKDHLGSQLSPVPFMTAVACATTKLRVGTWVINNDLRHPAVLAQDLASIDVISGGRLIVGLGAGWDESEYQEIGLKFEPAGRRIQRLEESIKVLKGCFSCAPFSYGGEHYRITEFEAGPPPVQNPHPPIMVGGGGKRLLEVAGREAQIVSLALRVQSAERLDPRGLTSAGVEQQIGWIRDAAGDRFPAIELWTYPSFGSLPVTVTNEAKRVIEQSATDIFERTGTKFDADELLESPHVFVGSVAELVEKCLSLRERFGISGFMIRDAIEEFAPVVERLAGR